MDRFVHLLSRPKLAVLTVFAGVSFINLTAYVWWFSFVWEMVVSVTTYVVGLLMLMIIGLGIAILIDNKFHSQLKRYFIIALLELLLIWSIANPIRTWQVKESFSRARSITDPLIKFKAQFGTYPASLTEVQEKLKLDLPQWTYLGTVYKYEQTGSENYWLSFQSYYGYTAHYNKDKDEWMLVD